MHEKPQTPNFRKIKRYVLTFLDTLSGKKRLGKIDDFLHILNFERRLAMLTSEERLHMDDESLSPAMRKRLGEASPSEREKITEEYARAIYLRKCAWIDYLNGVRSDKPFTSKVNARAVA